MAITDKELVDIVVDSVYTDKSTIELAESHDVNSQDLNRAHRGDTWNTIRQIAMSELIRIRISRRENRNNVEQCLIFLPAVAKESTPRQKATKGEDGSA